MASGLPVVSTELGTGTSFVNKNGETGLVVAPKDADALRNAIEFLLQNDALRGTMGEKARNRAVSEFSLDRMVDRIMKLYETASSY